MNTYYLRCRQSKLSTLIERGKRMGVIEEFEGKIVPVGTGAWDVIGVAPGPLAEGEDPETTTKPPRGGATDPWYHINFRTEHNLREKAIQKAQGGDADIATGLTEIANYFISDTQGNAVAPEFPLRVFL